MARRASTRHRSCVDRLSATLIGTDRGKRLAPLAQLATHGQLASHISGHLGLIDTRDKDVFDELIALD